MKMPLYLFVSNHWINTLITFPKKCFSHSSAVHVSPYNLGTSKTMPSSSFLPAMIPFVIPFFKFCGIFLVPILLEVEYLLLRHLAFSKIKCCGTLIHWTDGAETAKMRTFISPLCCSKLITEHQSLGGGSCPDAGHGSSFCLAWGDSCGDSSPAGQSPFEWQHNSGASAAPPSLALSAHLLGMQFVPSLRALMKVLKYCQPSPRSPAPVSGLQMDFVPLITALPPQTQVPVHTSIHSSSPHCIVCLWRCCGTQCQSLWKTRKNVCSSHQFTEMHFLSLEAV